MKHCKREIYNTQWNRHGSYDNWSGLEKADLKAYWGIILSPSINIRKKVQILAHLSRRLKWAIVIACRPSPSINFHIFNFFSRTTWWILMKLGRDKVLMVPYKCCCFSARSPQGRIQGGAKIGHRAPLLQETSSSDRKATATNRMHSSDLEACWKKCCYFWFHSKVKFLMCFWRFLDLVILPYFNAIYMDFLSCEVFDIHLFCVIFMFVSGRMHIFENFN